MSLWILLVIVFVAGGVGGVINALLSDNIFGLPKTVKVGAAAILRPGMLGNVLVSGVAAVVSWGLYGPFAASYVAGGPRAAAAGVQSVGLTLASLIGAVLVGLTGARWLTNEVDKRMLRAAAVEVASVQASPEVARRIGMATPAEALSLAQAPK
jgi:hypothetical protein